MGETDNSVNTYLQAAEQGDAAAQFQLGRAYYNGYGVEPDMTEAVKWYTKAAENGVAAAQYSLYECYFNGHGVAVDYQEALKWCRRAALNEHDNEWYLYGHGVTVDYQEALKWCRQAALDEHDIVRRHNESRDDARSAMCDLYMLQGLECLGEVDVSEIMKWVSHEAEQANILMKIFLAKCYANGEGVAKDNAAAGKWFGKAATTEDLMAEHDACQDLAAVGLQWAAMQGDANACHDLYYYYCSYYSDADFCSRQEFIDYTRRQEFKWCTKAAEKGIAEAQDDLSMYDNLKPDTSPDASEYTKAAENGDAAAQYNLAECYWEGRGVADDCHEALKWYRRSAVNGYHKAQIKMANFYVLQGRECLGEESVSEAMKWVAQAAEQGYVWAMLFLAKCYANGEGVAQDWAIADKWFEEAYKKAIATEACECGTIATIGRQWIVAMNGEV